MVYFILYPFCKRLQIAKELNINPFFQCKRDTLTIFIISSKSLDFLIKPMSFNSTEGWLTKNFVF